MDSLGMYAEEYRDMTGLGLPEANHIMEPLNISRLHDKLVVYEAQRLLDELKPNQEGNDYQERWLPVSRPMTSLDITGAIVTWDREEHPGSVYRIVETTISQKAIWTEEG